MKRMLSIFAVTLLVLNVCFPIIALAVNEENRVVLIDGAVGALTSGPKQIPSPGTKVATVQATGSGAISGTIKIYGGTRSTITTSTGTLVCTVNFSGTAPVPDFCPPWTAPFVWYITDFSSPVGTITGVTVEAGY